MDWLDSSFRWNDAVERVVPMVCLERLGVRDWPEVHALMVERGFPDVPDEYGTAAQRMAGVTLLGVRSGRRLGVVFVVGEDDEGISFLDVVCSGEQQGKWATRGLMATLAGELFGRMGLRCVWVQVHGRAALKAALQAGFTPATALDAKAPVLVMTRESAASLFNSKTRKPAAESNRGSRPAPG